MSILKLPIVVAGERRDETDAGWYRVTYESGLEVQIPRPSAADVAAIREASNEQLRSLPLDDILSFLDEVGRRWNDPDYPLRQEALRYATEITGYNSRVVAYDFFVVAAGLSRSKMYDFIGADLGEPYYLDEWRPFQSTLRRVVPRGKVLHVMVGNVPMAALFTIVRSVVTKNTTIAKLPQRDLVTSLFFALTCLDVDPEHPVSKSLSVLYWESGSPVQAEFADMADVVCVWGQQTAVDSVKQRMRYGQRFIEFGPRRSLHLIGRDTPDWEYAAMKAAYDVSVYDQEACFSPLVAFVEDPVDDFVRCIQPWLDQYLDVLPRGLHSPDVQAHVAQQRAEAQMAGHEVIGPEDGSWTLIRAEKPCEIPEHPLSRTLYVFPVADLRQAFDWIGPNAQTATVHPFSRVNEIGEELAFRGVERMVDIGRAGRPRPGFTHDGQLPLADMVRWVSIERPLSFKYHFVSDDPEDDDRAVYGWRGAAKEARPYRFVKPDARYGFRGDPKEEG